MHAGGYPNQMSRQRALQQQGPQNHGYGGNRQMMAMNQRPVPQQMAGRGMHVRGMGRAASQSSMVGRGRGMMSPQAMRSRINPNHQPALMGGLNTQVVRYNGGMQQHNMGRGNGTAGRIHPQQQMMMRGRGQQMMARGRGMQPMRGGHTGMQHARGGMRGVSGQQMRGRMQAMRGRGQGWHP